MRGVEGKLCVTIKKWRGWEEVRTSCAWFAWRTKIEPTLRSNSRASSKVKFPLTSQAQHSFNPWEGSDLLCLKQKRRGHLSRALQNNEELVRVTAHWETNI
jgi:hypothetical protein